MASSMRDYERQDISHSDNPPHVNITREPPGTPWDVRLGLTLLPARYVMRSALKSLTNSDTPPLLRKLTFLHHLSEDESRKAIDAINNFYRQHTDAIEQAIGKKPQQGFVPTGNFIFDKLDPVLGERNRAIHKKMLGTTEFANNSLEWATKEHYTHGDIKLTRVSERRIRGEMVTQQFDKSYSLAVGVGSLAMSWVIRKNVLKEMNSIYTEAVGYELGKDPRHVTEDDIFKSNNHIIQSTVHNFNRNQFIRGAISSLPFLRLIPGLRFLHTDDLAVGCWGALWAYDVWGRDPTMLETFHAFVKDKLNPLYGIGDKIKGSDILNIYQIYSFKFHPDRAFKVLSVSDTDESRLWARSERMFARMADLMNESYNFKHTTVRDAETGLPIAKANFTLPKLIYMLGHDMLNARQPEWSLLFIEVANKYRIEDLNECFRAKREGANIKDVLAKYPVDLTFVDDLQNGKKPSVLKQEEEAQRREDVTFRKAANGKAEEPKLTVTAGILADPSRLTPPAPAPALAG